MKRILLVTHYFAEHCGGVEIIAGQIAEQLTLRGWKVTWVASGPTQAFARDEIVRVPMRTWNIAEDRLSVPYPIWGPLSLIKLCALVCRCDVVHLHDSLYFGNVVAYFCARILDKPVVITQHIGPKLYTRVVLRILNDFANHTMARLLLAGCRRAVFYSTKVQRYFSPFVRFHCKPMFIANGVSTNRFRPVQAEERHRLRKTLGWPADKLIMLFVGRFMPVKNLALMKRLAPHFPAIEWMFVGWGPDNPASWGLGNVHCLGIIAHRDLPAYFQAADLFVLLTVGEGFPLAVQEAMACGLPVMISTDTASGVSDIENVVFATDLQWERVCSLMRELIDDPICLSSRGSSGLEFAHRHWKWETCAGHYEQLFTDAIQKP